MPPSFDVRVDDLTGARAESRGSAHDSDLGSWRAVLPSSGQVLPASEQVSAAHDPFRRGLTEVRAVLPGEGDTFYIETFGCQMNAHDSEKVAGVLLGGGDRPGGEGGGAETGVFNTGRHLRE